MSKAKVARDIVITVIDNLCIIDSAPDGITEKTTELYEAAVDYLIRDFEDELGVDYLEDDEDLD